MTVSTGHPAARDLRLSLRDGRGGVLVCRAAAPEEYDLCRRIRRQVFVEEQGVFAGSDHDGHDERRDAVHALGVYDGEPAGTVRLYPLDGEAGLWQGDRLAVLPRFRRYGVGAPLVRFAVAYAGAAGGARMAAHVQLPNVRFFERLGWQRAGDVETYVGQPHQPMSIPLSADGSEDAAAGSPAAASPAASAAGSRPAWGTV